MERQLNLSLVEGRLTRDPEVIKLGKGGQICKFDIAVNSFFKQGNDYKEEVDYFSVNVWNKLADACSKYLKKGAKVRVKGKLKQECWTASDGRKMSKVRIDASNVDFIGDNRRDKEKDTGTKIYSREQAVPF